MKEALTMGMSDLPVYIDQCLNDYPIQQLDLQAPGWMRFLEETYSEYKNISSDYFYRFVAGKIVGLFVGCASSITKEHVRRMGKALNAVTGDIDSLKALVKSNNNSSSLLELQKATVDSDILPPLKEVGASCSMTLMSQA